MVVAHFLKWINTAKVCDRVTAARALSTALVEGRLNFEERCAAEAALTVLLDDPSSKVRLAMAEALSTSSRAPVQIVAALAADQPEVATWVIGRSPLLTDADLIDRVAAGSIATQVLVARRPRVPTGVAASIAEVGAADACVALLDNPGADIAILSFRRMAERHGHLPGVRERLIANPRLPTECRHMLLVMLGETLRNAPLVSRLMGQRVDRVLREACIKGCMTVIDTAPPADHDALIERLRARGDLTSSFLIRMVAHGKIDFFGSAIVTLTGQSAPRVRAILAGGQDLAVAALLRSAGLAAATHAVIIKAMRIWRDVARGKRLAGAQEVSFSMLKALGEQAAESELGRLLKTIHLEALRDNARTHAMEIAAAEAA